MGRDGFFPRAFVSEPADILLTTPESLEVMLMSARVPARRLFANLRSVVIDEVTRSLEMTAGALSALLERLSRFCGQDVSGSVVCDDWQP